MNLLDSTTDEEFKNIVKSSNYLYEVGEKLGYTSQSTYKINRFIKKRMSSLGISLTKSKSLDKNYYKKGTYHGTIRRKVISDNAIEYKCSECGNTGYWNGKELALQIDHIDGDASNNEIINLRFLCPNCHSQTETYGNKNKIKRTDKDRHSHYDRLCEHCGKLFTTNGNRQKFCSVKCASNHRVKDLGISKEELESEIRLHGFSGTGKLHNVSDNAIKKWCVKLSLPTKIKFYK